MMTPKTLYQSLLQKKDHPESMTPAEIFDLDLTAAVQLLQDGMPLKETLDALKTFPRWLPARMGMPRP